MPRIIPSVIVMICGLLVVIGIYLPWVTDMTGDQIHKQFSQFSQLYQLEDYYSDSGSDYSDLGIGGPPSMAAIGFARTVGFIIIFCSLAALVIAIVRAHYNRSMPILGIGIVLIIMSIIAVGCVAYSGVQLATELEARASDYRVGLYMSGIAAVLGLIFSIIMASKYKIAQESIQWEKERVIPLDELIETPSLSSTKPKSHSEVTCPECGSKNLPSAKFCCSCGTKIVREDETRCQNCGKVNPPNASFCTSCGNKLGQDHAVSEKKPEPAKPLNLDPTEFEGKITREILCPKCGSKTVIRTVMKGPNTGLKFYVCVRFPECKGRTPVEESLF